MQRPLVELLEELKKNEYYADRQFIDKIIKKQDNTEREVEMAIAFLLAHMGAKRDRLIQEALYPMFIEYEREMKKHMKKRFEESFLLYVWVSQMVKGNFREVKVPKMPSARWHDQGKSYKDSIWDSNRVVFNGLSVNFMRSKVLNRDEVNVQSPFNGLKNTTKRLIDTESAWVEGQGAFAAGIEEGATHYLYVATIDSLTCENCAALNGKIFAYEDAEVGVNYRPMHPHCRCQCVPIVNGVKLDSLVNESMKFTDWKDRYVKGRR